MKIGVLGTGVVGQTIAAKLASLGHDVVMGTRNVADSQAKRGTGVYGMPEVGAWLDLHAEIVLATYADAAGHGEVLVNATNGVGSLDALAQAGGENLKGKLLLDISNPLDFSHGMPPVLSVCNTDSLAEQIQRAYPEARVVKTLNTVTAALMVDPRLLADGDHTIFVSGNDAGAKIQTAQLLGDWFGWTQIVDLGDITTARGVEMYLPLWLRLWGTLGTGMLNIRVVRA